MTITEKAKQLMNNREITFKAIETLTKDQEHWILSQDSIINKIIEQEKLDDIRTWSWEELHGFTLELGYATITLITSCHNKKHISERFNKVFEKHNFNSPNIDQLLEEEGYVAITANHDCVILT